MKQLAKHFGDELIAAGLQDGISWLPDGTILGYDDLPADRQAALDALIAAHDPTPPVAQVLIVSAAQAKVALFRRGLLEQVETAVAAYPRDVQIWYMEAREWARFNPYVVGIGIELGLTEPGLDDLFTFASTLAQ